MLPSLQPLKSPILHTIEHRIATELGVKPAQVIAAVQLLDEGATSWKRTGCGGPCPPIWRHRYFHKLYALDVELPDVKNPTKAALEGAMGGHGVGHAEIIGIYEKART
jgi:hypothetical protein